MKPKSQITAYIIWQTKIFLNPKIACYSSDCRKSPKIAILAISQIIKSITYKFGDIWFSAKISKVLVRKYFSD